MLGAFGVQLAELVGDLFVLKDITIQKAQRGQRLILRGCRHL
jgi:hypothetical protein